MDRSDLRRQLLRSRLFLRPRGRSGRQWSPRWFLRRMNDVEARTIEAFQIAEDIAEREVRTFLWDVVQAWWEAVHFPHGDDLYQQD